MRVVKLHRYGVRTYPLGAGRFALKAPGKPRLEIAKPLEAADEIWGPQELLTGSLATCFELTALAIARRRGVPIHAIRTDATGHVQSKDGISRFVVFDLDVDIETEEGCETAAEQVASRAREESLIARTIGVPIGLTVEARTPNANSQQPDMHARAVEDFEARLVELHHDELQDVGLGGAALAASLRRLRCTRRS